MDFGDYEKESKKLNQENEKYLEIFQLDLKEKALSETTIRRHLSNIDFYLNDFLVYRELIPMQRGYSYIDSFLGDFFIRKCMWSTPGTIKSTAASIKKFYKCMLDHSMIEKVDYEELCYRIKEDMETWLEDCRQYNDPDEENPFYMF